MTVTQPQCSCFCSVWPKISDVSICSSRRQHASCLEGTNHQIHIIAAPSQACLFNRLLLLAKLLQPNLTVGKLPDGVGLYKTSAFAARRLGFTGFRTEPNNCMESGVQRPLSYWACTARCQRACACWEIGAPYTENVHFLSKNHDQR